MLVPQGLLFFMANPGDGDVDEALDNIADFYGEAEEFEDDLIKEGQTSVQEADWATTARQAYKTYLLNKLVKNKGDEKGNPEIDEEVIESLDLNDDYVGQRIRAIAALTLGKSGKELKECDISDLLKFKDAYLTGRVETITNEEFRKVTKMRFVPHYDSHTKNMRCLGDSHYYLLPEFENNSDWDYDLRDMTKTRKEQPVVLEKKIKELENEIATYRKQKHGETGRHDEALLREYINLKYVAKENPRAQLDVMPAKKEEKN